MHQKGMPGTKEKKETKKEYQLQTKESIVQV